MPTVQSHFDEESYRYLIDNYEKGDRSEAVREAFKEVHGLGDHAEEAEA